MLELRNVTKKFNLTGRGEDERVALDNVTLKIESGDFVTVIGGNGSGKSTTMNIVTGALKPDEGQVLLNDVDITNMKEHERASYFGRVFQDPMMGTAGDMSVLENLEIAYRRGHRHSLIKWGFRKENKDVFVKELERFDLGLETRLNQKVGVMSGGQRQALTLIMAALRSKPSYRTIKRDYVKFCEKDRGVALEEFENEWYSAKAELNHSLEDIKNNASLSKEERKAAKKEAKEVFDKRIRKFDLTKQILLLDEHTAALDPKTAKKVLELTDKIVKENQLTTLMITHNMKDAITYGNRLVMFHMGHIILDVRDEVKASLTVEDLLKIFDEADKLAGIE